MDNATNFLLRHEHNKTLSFSRDEPNKLKLITQVMNEFAGSDKHHGYAFEAANDPGLIISTEKLKQMKDNGFIIGKPPKPGWYIAAARTRDMG